MNPVLQIASDVIQFAQTHESTMMVASAWAQREFHAAWPSVQLAYPWLKSEGGLKGVFGNILVGAKPATIQSDNTPVPPTGPQIINKLGQP